MIEGIIFDNEGVIINTETIWDQAQAQLLSNRDINYDPSEVKHFLTGKSDYDSVSWLKDYYGLKEDVQELRNERKTLFRSYLQKNVGFIDGFLDFFKEYCSGYKVAIATAMSQDLMEEVTQKLSLDNLFGTYIFSIDHVGTKSKPDPEIFLYAASKLNLDPKKCIVIEDSPSGLIGAKKAGMTSVGLATTFTAPFLKSKCDPDFIFEDYQSFGDNFDEVMK